MSTGKSDTTGQKRCFVIGPIGDEGSAIRWRSDLVLKFIIEPAAKECGYDPVLRSDKVNAPGLISRQIINHLIEDELVIADLTHHNPNVFYELAIRHAVQKPIVQIIEVGQKLPFDVSDVRTLFLDHQDLQSAHDCIDGLIKSIKEVENDPSLVDSPISEAVTIKALSQSTNPEHQLEARMLEGFSAIHRRLDELSSSRAPIPTRKTKRSIGSEQITGEWVRYLDSLGIAAESPVVTGMPIEKYNELKLSLLDNGPATLLEELRFADTGESE